MNGSKPHIFAYVSRFICLTAERLNLIFKSSITNILSFSFILNSEILCIPRNMDQCHQLCHFCRRQNTVNIWNSHHCSIKVWIPKPLINSFDTVSVTVCSFIKSFRIKEGNVFFNDTLNTFYLRLYRVCHIVKDH